MMFPPPEDVAVVMGQPKTWDIADRRVEKVDNPSLHSPSLAPTGKYALTIYTVAPDALAKGTWSDCGEELAEKLVSEAERHIPGLRQHTITRLILTPEDYRKRTHQNHHSFGGVPPVMGNKPPAHKTSIEGLCFIGAQSESTGGGVESDGWRTKGGKKNTRE